MAAVCAVLILLLLPYYPQLSISIMIGLPSISVALASFYALVLWDERKRLVWLLVSSLALGFSILIKGFAIVLVPSWLVGILLSARARKRESPHGPPPWIPPAAWLSILVLMAGFAVFFLVGPGHMSQPISVHLEARQGTAFQATHLLPPIEHYLFDSATVLLLALSGMWRLFRSDRGPRCIWSAGPPRRGFLTLNHPAWYHHQLLVTIPAGVLASAAAASSIHDLRGWRFGRPFWAGLALSLASVIVFLVFFGTRLPKALEEFDSGWPNLAGPPPGEEMERHLIARMWDHAADTRWLYTDRPMFAFLTQLPVPPNLAVISWKRLLTGELTEEEILAALEEYKPEMILTARFQIPVVQEFMRTRNYFRIDSTARYRLCFRCSSP